MNTDAAIRAVRGALQLYGLEETSRIDLVKYRENYVFRVTSGTGQSYAFRLHRAGYQSDAEIRTELAYLRALGDRGLSVPEVVPRVDGDLLCSVSDDDGAVFHIDVQKWLEGSQPLGHVAEAIEGASRLAPETFYRLGVLAAELHNHASAIGRVPGFQRRPWDAAGLVGEAALWGDPMALAALATRDAAILKTALVKLKQELQAMGTGPDTYGVIHADLSPENILVQDGHMIVIDFDDFGEGWHLFDLATILFFYLPHPQYEAYHAALIEGYSSARPLAVGFLEPWNVMLLARGLTYLGWAAARRGDEAAEFIVERVVPLVVGLAERYASGAVPASGAGTKGAI